MIIEKVCPHFTHQDDCNGEMVISYCTAMNQPDQDHEGNDKMYSCPLGFEAKQCYKVLSLGSDKVHQPTNADRMRAMTDEELADSRVGELVGIAPCSLWVAIDVPDKLVLSKKEAVQMELAWLQQPAKEE